MTKFFFLLHADGAVSFHEMVKPVSLDQFQAKALADGNPVVAVKEVDRAAYIARGPREYRAALTLDAAGTLTFDMVKAREIHRDRLRRVRAQRLADLDVSFMRALEAGSGYEAIAAEKQRLRDATADPRIAAATSIEELAAVWPL